MNFIPSKCTVYCLEPDRAVPAWAPPQGLRIKPFEAADLDAHFAEDPQRQSTFRTFLGQGYRGVLVLDGALWVGHAWVTLPGTPGPPHLPAWVGGAYPYWLFYAHTREAYRGRGIQKAMVQWRLALVTAPGGRRDRVYSDVRAGNVPSRRALLSQGFLPMGTLTSLALPVPFLGVYPLCHWDPGAQHPPLPGAVTQGEP